MLPRIRADFQLCESYVYREEPPLDCPITAFGGYANEFVSDAHLDPWRLQSSKHFRLRMLPGAHFFLNTAGSRFVREVAFLREKAAADQRYSKREERAEETSLARLGRWHALSCKRADRICIECPPFQVFGRSWGHFCIGYLPFLVLGSAPRICIWCPRFPASWLARFQSVTRMRESRDTPARLDHRRTLVSCSTSPFCIVLCYQNPARITMNFSLAAATSICRRRVPSGSR